MVNSTCQGPEAADSAQPSLGPSSSPTRGPGHHFSPPRAVNPYPKPRHQQPSTDLRCTLVVVSPAPSLSPCPAAGCTLTLVRRLPCLGLPADPIAGPGSAQRGQTLRDSACCREGTGCPRVTLAPSSLSLREQAALAAP